MNRVCVQVYRCHDAHADVVLWSSFTSLFSNTVVSVLLVSSIVDCWVGCAVDVLPLHRRGVGWVRVAGRY